MSTPKAYRLLGEDVNRLNQLIDRVQSETEKLGMKKVKESIMLRALLFYGENAKDEELIEAIKKAYMCA